MSKADIANRAKQARASVAAADIAGEFSEDVGDASLSNVLTSLHVLAGIAAADAICGIALGRRADGDSHQEAIALLATATLSGPNYARDLKRLLSVKANAQYSPDMISAETSTSSRKWVARLMAGMNSELAGPTRK